MPEMVIKLPDIGEGIAEAEISEWSVDVGDWINEDDVLGVVLTDKAAVEIPSSVTGKVLWLAGEPGDMLAIGAPLVKIDVAGDGEAEAADEPEDAQAAPAPPMEPTEESDLLPKAAEPPQPSGNKVLAAAAVRKRARDLGLELSRVEGTGPDGRILHADLDRYLAGQGHAVPPARDDGVTETSVIGLRRKIAEHLSVANARIPQITIVEEIDVTELERLRDRMNADRPEGQRKLTMLPFIVRAVVLARGAAPQVNARYDDDAGVLSRFDAVHFGVATQTDSGLVVPVIHHAEARSVWEIADEISHLAEAARAGTIGRDELSGSTITVTSLGPLGAIATTPIVNHPEVAIVGVNRKQVRPIWNGREFAPRDVMNISASFDHRIVDGWDAANFIARLKSLLETPALMFV